MDIDIQGLSVTYPSDSGLIRVLRHADLFLPHGKITALVGESGSGKSILGAAILGLLDPSAEVSGKILFEGQDLLTLSEESLNALRGSRIGWIAQDPVNAMNPVMRVGRQVTELICYRNGTREADEREAGICQLSRYGLGDAARVYLKYPGELSGGMAQRVLTAMGAMPGPDFLIADEPTKGLDAFVRREVADMFGRLRDEKGTGFLLITHDLRLAARLSDYTGIMYAGEILEYGRTEDVFRHPAHPYTERLLAAQPGASMTPIPGVPPDLSRLPDGCIFAGRCAWRDGEACGAAQRMKINGRGHAVRCWKGDLP